MIDPNQYDEETPHDIADDATQQITGTGAYDGEPN